MNTSHNETHKRSQFRPMGNMFDEGEKYEQPPVTDNQIASSIQTPIHDGQSDSHIPTPFADSPFRPLLQPVTDRQSVPPISPPLLGEGGSSQFKMPVTRWQNTGPMSPPAMDWQGTGPMSPPAMNRQSTGPMSPPAMDWQNTGPMSPPAMDWQGTSQFRLPVTANSAYQPAYAPLTDRHGVPFGLPKTPTVKKRQRNVRLVILMNAVLVVLLVAGGVTAWALQHHTSLPQILNLHNSGSSVQTPVDAAPALNSITNNKEISPLLFGTNMGLYHDADEPMLHSPQTRQLLKDIGVRSVRMPTRPTLSDATETAAAQAIKDIGAVPLVVIAGPGYPGGSILQTNQHTLGVITKVFGKAPVYYEFGNESDLSGVTVEQYIAIWNQVVPVLKQQFPTARFIGPDNYQFTRAYLKTFLQQATPLPDGVSWHEYACSVNWAADFCLANIDAWNAHFAQARLAMQEAIGKQLPIWITEWNYASDTNGQMVNDGKSNNLAFMQAWTAKAMQTLIANRIFAAMQYYATDAPMPLITNNQIGVEGQIFQQEYKQVMVDGTTPPMPTITYPTPTTTVNPHDAFSFEDGTTGGWSSFGPGISPAVNSSALAFDGTHSLEFTLKNASENDTPYIAVDANRLPTQPQAGQLLTAYIYVANTAALMNAKIFVANPQHAWLFANSITLTPGHWNKVWFGLPLNFSNQVSQVGIQFFTSTPGVSSDIYVDGISWQ